MQRRMSVEVTAMAIGFVALTAGVFAQAPAGRGAGAAAGQGGARGAAAAGRGAADAATRPALLWREEWKQPPYTGTLNDENRRVTQDAVTNPRLELKIYGTTAKEIGVYNHEGRFDLWTGITTSPVAMTLRDKANYVDLTGLARLRWMVRTGALHVAHPVVRLADGTFLAGSFTQSNDGEVHPDRSRVRKPALVQARHREGGHDRRGQEPGPQQGRRGRARGPDARRRTRQRRLGQPVDRRAVREAGAALARTPMKAPAPTLS